MFTHGHNVNEEAELALKKIYDSIKSINNGNYIVEANGNYGVVSLEKGEIIHCKYPKITGDNNFITVHGEVIQHKLTLFGFATIRTKGLFNLDGREIVPIGNFQKSDTVEDFGVALHDIQNNITVIVSNKEKVRNDLKGDKLIDVRIPGYAALVKLENGAFGGRVFIDLELNTYETLFHLYDMVKKVGEGTFMVMKEDRYRYTDEYGVPASKEWYEKF